MENKLDLQKLVIFADFADMTDAYTLKRSRAIVLRHLGTGRTIQIGPLPDGVIQDLLLFLKSSWPSQGPLPSHQQQQQYLGAGSAAQQVPQVPVSDGGLSFEVAEEDMSGLGGSDPTSDF